MKQILEVQLLGTGTIFSDVHRSCTSTLLKNNSVSILIDAGPGTLERLKQAQFSPLDLEYIFITHFHPDHISDLVPILLYRFLRSVELATTPMQIWGPTGLRKFMQNMKMAYGDWLDEKMDYFLIHELSHPYKKFPGFQCHWKKVIHSPESTAYRFEFEDKIVSFSGDSGYCQNLVDICRDADLAILECSFPDDQRKEEHLSPSLVRKVAIEANIKRVVITHLYPEMFKIKPLPLIKKGFKGLVEIGKDLQIYKIV